MYKYPVYRPNLTGNERRYVNEAIDSTWISSKGEFIPRFERAFAEYIGSCGGGGYTASSFRL